MARFCVVVTLAVCCLVTCSSGNATDPVSASVTKECSVERSGVLTMFNGQTSTVAVPCKYRLAIIDCGDYRLAVTPGSKLDSNNTFSPDYLWVNIVKTAPGERLFVRTTSRRLRKSAKGKIDNPWLEKKGNRSSFGLDLAGYDSAKEAAVLRKDGVFEVEFNADQASVVVRCFSDSFSSTSQPDALCGNGESGNSTTMEEILHMVFSNRDLSEKQRRSCLRAASEYQQCVAAETSNFRDCNEILLKQATVDCLASSDTPLIDYYRGCLGAICKNDNRLVESLILDIYNNRCELDPGTDCAKAKLIFCDSRSTCESDGICKRKLSETCAGFSDHCVSGTTCDPDTNICTAVKK